MKASIAILIGIILGATLLLTIVIALNVNTAGLVVPSTHQQIINQLTIIDKVTGKKLTYQCTSVHMVVPLSVLPASITYTAGKSYQTSEWSCYSGKDGKDRNAVVDIWGPFDDGKTYGVEVARLCWNALSIQLGTQTATFPQVQSSTDAAIGYIGFALTLSG